jgi:hypothetical protein
MKKGKKIAEESQNPYFLLPFFQLRPQDRSPRVFRLWDSPKALGELSQPELD